LALTTGSITRTLPTPGVSSRALGLKTLVEGQFLHDHVLLADTTADMGVTPPPFIGRLGLPVNRGRLVVDEYLRLREGVWAAGDSAAARDPFSAARADYPPTAQHAQRQGVVIGRNLAASHGIGRARRYRHHDLGLVADLGGAAAVARPMGVPLTGPPAKVVTKAYHLYALPAASNRLRVAADWALNLVSRPIASQLDLVPPTAATLTAEIRGQNGMDEQRFCLST
jgi:NADH dehydrogenase